MHGKQKPTRAENITLNLRTALVVGAVVISGFVQVALNKQTIETQLAVDHAALESIKEKQGEIKEDIKEISRRVKHVEEGYIRIGTKMGISTISPTP